MLYPSSTIRVMVDATRKISGMIMRDYYELQLLQNSRNSLDNFYNHLVKRAEQKLQDALLKVRPDFLMDIESVPQGDFWVFNVLEGSVNFLHALPNFTVSIAHVRKKNGRKEVVLGVIFAPVSKEIFFAEIDKGAWFERFDMHQDRPESLRVSGRKNKESLLCASNHNIDGVQLRNLGSSAMSLGYLSAGRLDAVVLHNYDYKDTAAGLLIAEQAGAIIEVTNDKIIAATEYAKTQCNL